jgi:hypothetical protein
MAEKQKFPSTPKGLAMYAWLTRADTKFDADGVYKVNLVLDPADAAPIIEAIDKQAAEFLAEKRKAEKNPVKAKRLKMSSDTPYAEDEDGNIVIKFKMKAKGKTKAGEEFTQKPKLFDAKGKPITGDIPLGNGSTIRVSYEMVSYLHPKEGAGITLRLRAVQVIELVAYVSGGSADDFGFDEEEGGFASDEEPQAKPADASADAEGDDEEEAEEEGNGDF